MLVGFSKVKVMRPKISAQTFLLFVVSWLILKAPSKIAADDTVFFYFYLLNIIRHDVSCESSAKQRIHMKYHALFSLKKR